MFVALLSGMFLGMYTINSLTPKPIPTKFRVLTNQNTTKTLGYKRILISASIGVSLNKIYPINPHMHGLLLGGGGVFFGVRFFLGALLWQRPLGSVLKTHYHGKTVLLVRSELQEGDVGRSKHA
jgi:hypothetical protein